MEFEADAGAEALRPASAAGLPTVRGVKHCLLFRVCSASLCMPAPLFELFGGSKKFATKKQQQVVRLQAYLRAQGMKKSINGGVEGSIRHKVRSVRATPRFQR